MAIRVTLSNATRGATSNPVLTGDKLNLSRVVYQKLGSIVQNQTLSADYTDEAIPHEYRRILERLGDYHNEKYYTTTNVIGDDIKALDEYLGSLGITVEYAYSKDLNNSNEWLDPGTQSEYRVLCEDIDAPQIVLMDGDEILISYT